MITPLFIIAAILVIFAAERVGVTLAVRNMKARAWIRKHPLLHPNGISLVRIPAGIVGVAIWLAGLPAVAILWFAFWMITDLTDGTIARNCDLITERGKWLDPLSDKCLYLPFLFLFAYTGELSFFWVVLLMAADIGGQVSRLFTGRSAANQFGKAKTALITILLALTALMTFDEIAYLAAEFVDYLLVTATILAVLSFIMKVLTIKTVRILYPFFKIGCALTGIAMIFTNQAPFPVFLLLIAPDVFKFCLDTSPEVLERSGFLMNVRVFAAVLLYAVLAPLLLSHATADVWLPLFLAAAAAVAVALRIRRSALKGEVPDSGEFTGFSPAAAAVIIGCAAIIFANSSWFLVPIVGFTVTVLLLPLPCVNLKVRLWDRYPPSLRVVLLVALLLVVNFQLANLELTPLIIEPLLLAMSAASAILWRQSYT